MGGTIKDPRFMISGVITTNFEKKKKIFLHFLKVYDYLMKCPSFFFSNDPPKVPKMTAKVQNFAQKNVNFEGEGGVQKIFRSIFSPFLTVLIVDVHTYKMTEKEIFVM